jgi:hypothetical protein
MVGIAKAMITVVIEIGFPEIMNGPSIEIGKDADVIHGMSSAFGMNFIVS